MAAADSEATAAAAASSAGSSGDFVDEDTAREQLGRKVRDLLFGFSCRFYPKVKPAEEELCMVKVRRVAEMGAYVDLVEYEDREGMVLLSELSRRRIRSIKKLISEGRMEVCMVIRVNADADYIDLSKRRVDKDEKEAYEDRFNRAVIVQNAMRTIVKDTFDPAAHPDDFNPLESICQRLSWKLYEKYDHAHTGLRAIAKDPSLLDEYDLTDAEKASLLGQLAKKNKATSVKVRTDVNLTCFHYEGVLAIRNAVAKAEQTSTEDHEIVVTTVAPPLYSISTSTAEIPAGIEALKKATEAVKAAIEEFGGELDVVVEPSTAAADDA